MMDAAEIWPMRAHVRRPLILVVEHREMDVAVGQERGAVTATAQLFEAECLFVEFGGSRRVLGGQGDVADAGHGVPPRACGHSGTTPSARPLGVGRWEHGPAGRGKVVRGEDWMVPLPPRRDNMEGIERPGRRFGGLFLGTVSFITKFTTDTNDTRLSFRHAFS